MSTPINVSVDVSSLTLHGPGNITVFSHSTVNFRCTSARLKDIEWKYVNGSIYITIFDRRGRNERVFDTRFVRTVNGANSTLTIHNVQKSDEGMYCCCERLSSQSKQYIQLTVIGKCVLKIVYSACLLHQNHNFVTT